MTSEDHDQTGSEIGNASGDDPNALPIPGSWRGPLSEVQFFAEPIDAHFRLHIRVDTEVPVIVSEMMLDAELTAQWAENYDIALAIARNGPDHGLAPDEIRGLSFSLARVRDHFDYLQRTHSEAPASFAGNHHMIRAHGEAISLIRTVRERIDQCMRDAGCWIAPADENETPVIH